MLSIMASLAQQESQSLSHNVKMGLQYRYQQGEVQVNCNRFLGYTRGENNELVIVPEEAEVVKRIFREYLEGASKLKTAQVENVGRDDLRKRNAEMSIFLLKQQTVIKEYDEKLVRRLSDKVKVYEDLYEVVFRSGVMVDVVK